jgi:purine-nucleoside phosphorylase
MVGRPQTPLSQLARDTAAAILDRAHQRPRIAMLLGTGHSGIANRLERKVVIRGEDLPTPVRLSEGSPMVLGELEGRPVVIADAPLAPYEGHSGREVTFPVRVVHALGIELLVLTAGAASLSRFIEPGMVCLVEDHINLTGLHPLQGPYDERLGPRFPDMSDPYPARWRKLARNVAHDLGISCLEGVFAAVPGPSLPTRAEYRFLRRVGADLVGMSLVPEVMAAVHSGLDVLALVGVTQHVQVELSAPVDIESMLDAADVAGPRMASLLAGVVSRFPS